MTFDPTNKATEIVVSDSVELAAIAQMSQVRRKPVTGLTPKKFVSVLGLELEQALTIEQFTEIYTLLATKYGCRAIETLFDAESVKISDRVRGVEAGVGRLNATAIAVDERMTAFERSVDELSKRLAAVEQATKPGTGSEKSSAGCEGGRCSNAADPTPTKQYRSFPRVFFRRVNQ